MEQVSMYPSTEVEQVNEYTLSMNESLPNSITTARTSTNNNASAYWIGGIIALVVGWFVLGIPCSLLAIHLGGKAIEHGAKTAGKIVRWSGWVLLLLMVLFIMIPT